MVVATAHPLTMPGCLLSCARKLRSYPAMGIAVPVLWSTVGALLRVRRRSCQAFIASWRQPTCCCPKHHAGASPHAPMRGGWRSRSATCAGVPMAWKSSATHVIARSLAGFQTSIPNATSRDSDVSCSYAAPQHIFGPSASEPACPSNIQSSPAPHRRRLPPVHGRYGPPWITDMSKRNAPPRLLNLALQGGGDHGAFTWGVLDQLLEDGRTRFEGVSGTSAVAMNAVALAHGLLEGGADDARAALSRFWLAVASSSPLQLAGAIDGGGIGPRWT